MSDHLEGAALAKSILQQLLEGLYEGSGSCIGMPQLRAGDMIEIRGLGKRFSGKYRLRRVTHTIDDSGYRTTFEVAQRYTTNLLQSLRNKINDSPPPNRQGRIEGIMVAKVKNNINDPRARSRSGIFSRVLRRQLQPLGARDDLHGGRQPVRVLGRLFPAGYRR